MDDQLFDSLARALASRRSAVRMLLAALMGGGLSRISQQPAAAACKREGGRCQKGKGRKGKKGKKGRKRRKGATCCSGSTCQKGRCRCAQGQQDCDGDGRCETSVLTDPVNCGACGQTCAEDQRCDGGRCLCLDATRTCGDICCPNAQECCGAVCRNLQGDEQNCGDCGIVCKANERCLSGECRNVQI